MKVEIQKADVPNGNGRIYPKNLLEKLTIQPKQIYGTIGMPDSCDLDLTQISHKIENLRIEDGSLVGTMSILATPQGNVLADLVKADVGKFRCAGIGHVIKDSDGNYQIQDGYKLISINYTLDPA